MNIHMRFLTPYIKHGREREKKLCSLPKSMVRRPYACLLELRRALRARQTAEILAQFIDTRPSVEVFNSINPNDPIEAFAQLVDDWSEDLLVVGHLPFMSKLVSLLLKGSEEQAIVSYTAGSIVCIESTGDGGWQLLWMVRPGLLIH